MQEFMSDDLLAEAAKDTQTGSATGGLKEGAVLARLVGYKEIGKHRSVFVDPKSKTETVTENNKCILTFELFDVGEERYYTKEYTDDQGVKGVRGLRQTLFPMTISNSSKAGYVQFLNFLIENLAKEDALAQSYEGIILRTPGTMIFNIKPSATGKFNINLKQAVPAINKDPVTGTVLSEYRVPEGYVPSVEVFREATCDKSDAFIKSCWGTRKYDDNLVPVLNIDKNPYALNFQDLWKQSIGYTNSKVKKVIERYEATLGGIDTTPVDPSPTATQQVTEVESSQEATDFDRVLANATAGN